MNPEILSPWMRRAQAFDAHGILKVRACVLALIEADYTHSEIAEELNLGHRSEVANHVHRYRNRDYENAKWLSEYAPDI